MTANRKHLGKDEVSLFETWPRTNPLPMRHGEGHYAFLDRAAGDLWDKTRDLLEQFLARVKDDKARVDMAGRITSGSNDEFDSAWWELYLHETFRRCGFEIIIHPETGTNRHPDFLVRMGELGMYVEATSGRRSRAQEAELNRQSDLHRAMDEDDFGPWDLGIRLFKTGGAAVPSKRIIKAVKETLGELPPADPSTTAIYFFTTTVGGTTIEFEVRPRTGPQPPPALQRAVTQFPIDFNADSVTPVSKALRKKSRRYGELDHPLMVAIFASDIVHTNRSVDAALFGEAASDPSGLPLILQDADDFPRTLPHQSREGFWRHAGGWTRQHVAAVLVGHHQIMWRTAQYAPDLWIHPVAEPSLVEQVPIWAHNIVTPEGQVTRVEPRRPCAQFFGLPADWPGISID